MRHEAEVENRFSKLGGLFVAPARVVAETAKD